MARKPAAKATRATDQKPNLRLVDTTGPVSDHAAASATSSVSAPTPDLTQLADALATNVLARATQNAYGSDWRHFSQWCGENNHEALPATPETVRLYLTDHAETFKPATLGRRLVAICKAHKDAGVEPPTRAEAVRRQMVAIRRSVGTAQTRKTPLLPEQLRKIVAALPLDTLTDKRDRALLLLGFSSAFRRSELVGLAVTDVAVVPEGLLITLRRSKTDQEGRGRQIGIPQGTHPETCPVAAFHAWVQAAGIKSGPLFRRIDRHGNVGKERLTGMSVALIVKRSVAKIGLEGDPYAGHSLRAGLVTAAARAKVPDYKIMAQTGHKSRATLEKYIRDAAVFENNAAAGAGL